MIGQDLVAAIEPVVALFEQLGIAYAVVGSVASSAHGMARATIDVDLVAALPMAQVDALVAALADEYYVDRDAARDAVTRTSMFNLVHLRTMLKVDIYVLSARAFDRESFARRRPLVLEPPGGRAFEVELAEDTVLHKLEWFHAGGRVSDRQWGDLVGVLRVQGPGVDVAYLRRWAGSLGIEDLLERALAEAGVVPG